MPFDWSSWSIPFSWLRYRLSYGYKGGRVNRAGAQDLWHGNHSVRTQTQQRTQAIHGCALFPPPTSLCYFLLPHRHPSLPAVIAVHCCGSISDYTNKYTAATWYIGREQDGTNLLLVIVDVGLTGRHTPVWCTYNRHGWSVGGYPRKRYNLLIVREPQFVIGISSLFLKTVVEQT